MKNLEKIAEENFRAELGINDGEKEPNGWIDVLVILIAILIIVAAIAVCVVEVII